MMVHLNRIIGMSLVAAVAFSGAAYAETPAAIAPGATVIDIAGEVTTAGLSGGMADSVPLFSGPSGPVVFVMSAPDEEQTTLDKAQTAKVPLAPRLSAPRAR